MRFKAETASGGTKALRGVTYMPGDVTADNFVDKAKAFVGRPDDWPVVRKADNAIAFWAWIAFWQHLGRRTGFAERQDLLTVPATFPWDFSVDADGMRDEDLAPAVAREAPISPEHRRELAAMLRGAVPRDLKREAFRRRPNNRLPNSFEASHQPTPSDQPIVASEALLATLGRSPPTGEP